LYFTYPKLPSLQDLEGDKKDVSLSSIRIMTVCDEPPNAVILKNLD